MWDKNLIEDFSSLDDFYVAPFHEDMTTTGTFTYIWSVVVNDELFIRAGYGQKSRWFAAAKAQKAGKIRLGDKEYDVIFELVPEQENEPLMQDIDKAYFDKYGKKDLSSTRLMTDKVTDGPRSTTVRVIPR